jgi:nucleotide-binding universal stress UspA family protein
MRTKYITLQAKARKFAEDAGLTIEADLSNGDEVESILKAARHHQSDLLVIGMPKHNWIIGHTAQEVAEHVPCALLGIR